MVRPAAGPRAAGFPVAGRGGGRNAGTRAGSAACARGAVWVLGAARAAGGRGIGRSSWPSGAGCGMRAGGSSGCTRAEGSRVAMVAATDVVVAGARGAGEAAGVAAAAAGARSDGAGGAGGIERWPNSALSNSETAVLLEGSTWNSGAATARGAATATIGTIGASSAAPGSALTGALPVSTGRAGRVTGSAGSSTTGVSPARCGATFVRVAASGTRAETGADGPSTLIRSLRAASR